MEKSILCKFMFVNFSAQLICHKNILLFKYLKILFNFNDALLLIEYYFLNVDILYTILIKALI